MLQLRCQEAFLDEFEVAVKRGWLQIDAGEYGLVNIKNFQTLKIEGSEGRAPVPERDAIDGRKSSLQSANDVLPWI
jgi:hypothetical protein